MFATVVLLGTTLAGLGASQQIGTNIPEIHPKLTTYKCTKAAGCKAQNTAIVLDQDWRRVSVVGDPRRTCKELGLEPLNRTLCPDAITCGRNCALEGVNYTQFGVHTKDDAITLNMYTPYLPIATQPRVYLLDATETTYENVRMLDAEISFDVDVSKLPCGMNGALYLSEMEMTGGRSALNPAGASRGTGYCDAQCPKAYTWVNGVANINYTTGTCCSEMDLWEANSRASKYVAHVCTKPGLFPCKGADCDLDGVCAKTGCSFNTYRQGHPTFYARGGTGVDTTRPFTVTTQFLAGTDGAMTEIRRLWAQGGRVIANPPAVSGKGDSVTESFCEANNFTAYTSRGGMEAMGRALGRGMVLVAAIWNQPDGFMQSLDGGVHGPCNATEGDPKNIQATAPDTQVTFSNIRWGEIGSTLGV